MSKGRTTDASGKIDPALLPILTQSANNIMGVQNRNPVTDYSESYQKPVAGLSDYQRFAGSKIGGLDQPKMGDYLALQNIMGAKQLAGRTPTTGGGDATKPGMGDYKGALQSYGGQWIPGTPSGNLAYTAPSIIGPRQGPPRPGNGLNPNPGNDGGGSNPNGNGDRNPLPRY